MTRKPKWQDHPSWHLTFIVPLLIFVIFEDDAITRFLEASALVLSAIRYGRESARPRRDRYDRR
ncbi:MAG: hypothetical protein QOF84_5199 [Streptomyces sp.]|jgi:hypothetical protein|nr:hypothetical protein [Streptomyces sp.]MDX6350409.1 hypothetical protein [Streptomyces sp.]